MTVRALVRIELSDGNDWDRGPFEFVQLPAFNDVFTIREHGGSQDDVRVRYAKHIPIRVGEDDQPSEPSVILIVELLTGRSD